MLGQGNESYKGLYDFKSIIESKGFEIKFNDYMKSEEYRIFKGLRILDNNSRNNYIEEVIRVLDTWEEISA